MSTIPAATSIEQCHQQQKEAKEQQDNIDDDDIKILPNIGPSPPTSSSLFELEGPQLPTNVCKKEQLDSLPEEFLSGDKDRPLQHIEYDDEIDDALRDEEQAALLSEENEHIIYNYSLNPMIYSVIYILLIELLERFSFYGINYTQTMYLTGIYNKNWNAHFTSIEASSYVSISTAIAYTTPFLGAILADKFFGDYYSILLGAICLYLPGLILIFLTTIPNLITTPEGEFNDIILALGLLVLWPIGTGIVKSIVNVFGAKQYHPLLQSSLIESYYVNFYMCINIGALGGGIIIPIVASTISVTIAYLIPVIMLSVGIIIFLLGSYKYVIHKPKKSKKGGNFKLFSFIDKLIKAIRKQIYRSKKSNIKSSKNKKKQVSSSSSSDNTQQQQFYQHSFPTLSTINANDESAVQQQQTTSTIELIIIISRISILIVPFCIAYSQMATTFIIQGTVMKKACWGYIDAAQMNNADAISVLIFGYIIGNKLYPWLSKNNIKIPTSYKFAFGSFLGLLAICWSLIIDYMIHYYYIVHDGYKISIMYQCISYILIGIGEIFAVSSAYEVAFTIASPSNKALASATNLFFIGSFPNIFCVLLYNTCRSWFYNHKGEAHINTIHLYVEAKVYNYFWILALISLFGIIINLLPCVKNYIANIEEKAIQETLSRSRSRTPSRTPSKPSTPKFNKSPKINKKLRIIHNNNYDDNDPNTSTTKQQFLSLENRLLQTTTTAVKQQLPSSATLKKKEEESEPLLLNKAKKHQNYLKYGSGPVLYKHGSMRAGPSLSNQAKKNLNKNNKNHPKNKQTNK